LSEQIGDEQRGELVEMRLDRLRRLDQQLAPPFPAQRLPRRQRALRRGDREVELGLSGRGRRCKDLSGRGIDHVDAVRSVDRGAIDGQRIIARKVHFTLAHIVRKSGSRARICTICDDNQILLDIGRDS